MLKAGCVQCSQIIRPLGNVVTQQRSEQKLYYNRLGITFNKILCWQDCLLHKPQQIDCRTFIRKFTLSTNNSSGERTRPKSCLVWAANTNLHAATN